MQDQGPGPCEVAPCHSCVFVMYICNTVISQVHQYNILLSYELFKLILLVITFQNIFLQMTDVEYEYVSFFLDILEKKCFVMLFQEHCNTQKQGK